MLTITIPAQTLFDNAKQEFIESKPVTIQLEHSLVSISKWESKWKKSFIHSKDKTLEEIRDYVRCMTITQNVSPDAYYRLTSDNIDEIDKYINDSQTATTIKDTPGVGKEVVTAEIIYYWMILYNIPVEFQKWHINRLLTLIRVCSIKSQPQKKMSKAETLQYNRALNAARRNRKG